MDLMIKPFYTERTEAVRTKALSTGVQQMEGWTGKQLFPHLPSQCLCPLGHLEAQCEREQMQGWDFGAGSAVISSCWPCPFQRDPPHTQFCCVV